MTSAPFAGGGNTGGFNASGLDSGTTINQNPQTYRPGGPLGTSSANPFLANFPAGTSMPPFWSGRGAVAKNFLTDPGEGPSYGGSSAPVPSSASPEGYSGNGMTFQGGAPNASGLAGLNPANLFGFGGVPGSNSDIFGNTYPTGVGSALTAFLGSGAGFNPEVINALWQSMQPQIQQGEANVTESFGAQGLGDSSAAAYGQAQYQAQVADAYGSLVSQMYEQSVNNYMSVLTSGHSFAPQPSGIGALIGGAGALAGGIGSLYHSGIFGNSTNNNNQTAPVPSGGSGNQYPVPSGGGSGDGPGDY
jgi:hypothetical protein